ncbi:hypothetical protein LTR08_001518 [Meristemomyces frigidus]|nr:hypothetical protein LTR08_001518 [Meristemomyces frigidus]
MASGRPANHTWTEKQRTIVRLLYQRSGLDQDAHDDVARVFDHIVRNVFNDKISAEGVSAAKLKNINDRKGKTWAATYDLDSPGRPELRAREAVREELMAVIRQALSHLGMAVPSNGDDEAQADEAISGEGADGGVGEISGISGHGDAADATMSDNDEGTAPATKFVHAGDCSVPVRGAGFVFTGSGSELDASVELQVPTFATHVKFLGSDGEQNREKVKMCVASKCPKCAGEKAMKAKQARYEVGGDLYERKRRQGVDGEEGME